MLSGVMQKGSTCLSVTGFPVSSVSQVCVVTHDRFSFEAEPLRGWAASLHNFSDRGSAAGLIPHLLREQANASDWSDTRVVSTSDLTTY